MTKKLYSVAFKVGDTNCQYYVAANTIQEISSELPIGAEVVRIELIAKTVRVAGS